jgi:hypothetical protein
LDLELRLCNSQAQSPRQKGGLLRCAYVSGLEQSSSPKSIAATPALRRAGQNLLKGRAHGVAILRDPFCNAWAMPNGRCRVHGGASTGPKSPEGKARVVAAMVAGRRAWAERQRVEGRKFPAGRKRGAEWITEPMRERARAEARRLGAGRFTLHRSLTLALLKSAKGDPAARAKAKAMLDAQERAAIERDRQRALAIVNRLRAEAMPRRPDAFAIPVKIGPNACAVRVEPPADVSAKYYQNIKLAFSDRSVFSNIILWEKGGIIAKPTLGP